MADWNTRLAVAYIDDAGKSAEIAPIDSMSTTFNLNAEPLHSLGATHVGVVYQPSQVNFSMTVKAIGPAAAELTAIALRGGRFDIVLQEQSGTDWSFRTVVMSDCVVTASAQSASIAGAPTVTFSGFSLAAKVEGKSGPAVAIP
ncbi:hypothetical protein ABT093_34530 [Kitasatospora sp. NPDC002551]|uniref:hypothetical protein n=1 Tax=unclassified Kitasatospora TaxID=2633591 RepID=UPI0033167E16